MGWKQALKRTVTRSEMKQNTLSSHRGGIPKHLFPSFGFLSKEVAGNSRGLNQYL